MTHTTSGATWPDVSADGTDDRVCRLHHRRLRPVFDAVSSRARRPRERSAPLGGRIKRHAGFDAGSVAIDDLFTAGHAATDIVVTSRRKGRRSSSPRRRGLRNRRARLPLRTRPTATWLVASPEDAPTPAGASPDWFVSTPTIDGGRPYSSRRRSRRRSSSDPRPTAGRRRPRLAVSGSASGSGVAVRQGANVAYGVAEYRPIGRRIHAGRSSLRSRAHAIPDCLAQQHRAEPTATRSAVKMASPVGATAEFVRRALGSSATPPSHRRRAGVPARRSRRITCLPSRAGGGVSSGDHDGRPHVPAGRRRPDLSVTDFGSDAFSLLRGFAAEQFRRQPRRAHQCSSIAGRSRGRSAATGPGRSSCTRCTPRCSPTPATRGRDRSTPTRSSRRSARELSADLVAGFFAPFTVNRRRRVGTRRQRRDSRSRDGYFRVGKAF